jgi:poly-gamma-glutamate capsule biosynthesis protein CapA/YwtB (metallophosphatase superfamily)
MRSGKGLSIIAAVLLLIAVAQRVQSETRRLYLSFLGDIMIHTANYLTPDYGDIYTSLRPILLRDTLSFANLEFPVDPTRPYSSYPCFNAPQDYLEAAVDAGIDVFSLANNHAFDQDLDGIAQTLRSLEDVGRRGFRRIYYQGTRQSMDAPFAPVEIRVKGVRVGFMAVTQTVNWPMPGPYVHVVDYANPRHREYFLPQIAALSGRYDLFILSYHGGREYAPEPDERKVCFFRQLVDAGVDIVYAHHPHVLQRYELVERAEGSGLILCSTGNLISGMTGHLDPEAEDDPLAWTGDSALWLVVVRVEEGGVTIEEVTPLPISNYRDRRGVTGVHTFTALAGEELPESWLNYYRKRHSSLRALFRQWVPR